MLCFIPINPYLYYYMKRKYTKTNINILYNKAKQQVKISLLYLSSEAKKKPNRNTHKTQ